MRWRRITGRNIWLPRPAGANPAAAHHHFGSKEALLDAVIERRARPLNAQRLRKFERHEAERGGARPEVENIFRAFPMSTLRDLSAAPESAGPRERPAALSARFVSFSAFGIHNSSLEHCPFPPAAPCGRLISTLRGRVRVSAGR